MRARPHQPAGAGQAHAVAACRAAPAPRRWLPWPCSIAAGSASAKARARGPKRPAPATTSATLSPIQIWPVDRLEPRRGEARVAQDALDAGAIAERELAGILGAGPRQRRQEGLAPRAAARGPRDSPAACASTGRPGGPAGFSAWRKLRNAATGIGEEHDAEAREDEVVGRRLEGMGGGVADARRWRCPAAAARASPIRGSEMSTPSTWPVEADGARQRRGRAAGAAADIDRHARRAARRPRTGQPRPISADRPLDARRRRRASPRRPGRSSRPPARRRALRGCVMPAHRPPPPWPRRGRAACSSRSRRARHARDRPARNARSG